MAEEESDSEAVCSDADAERKSNFLASCHELREKVSAVESIQIDILITLLTSADATSEVSLTTKTLLLGMYRIFDSYSLQCRIMVGIVYSYSAE